MKSLVALALCFALSVATPSTPGTTQSVSINDQSNAAKQRTDRNSDDLSENGSSSTRLPNYAQFLLSKSKDVMEDELRYLDDQSANDKIQEEVAKTFKAEADKYKPSPRLSTTAKPSVQPKIEITVRNSTLDDLKKLAEVEDMGYDDLGDDEDEEDEDDEEYDDEDEEDELDDDEEVMTQCPDYCKCAGQYAAATTATCTKLVEEQSFGPSIAHLKIENAGEIRLGPYALRTRGLQQIETTTITDTRILELDRTAFVGVPYLFAVNLTRNGLYEIHPQIFQNNSQLGLLTISGNPLRHTQFFKPAKHYLLDAPSITELDFSDNGITRLHRLAFSKMQSLSYINLKGNRLTELDKFIFTPLEALVELDLSNNMLNDLAPELFDNGGLQTLRMAGNNLSTIASVRASKLKLLDVSNNRIKTIAKEDLAGVPSLEHLYIKSNGLKKIHQHAFDAFEQLTDLDISDNKLTLLTEHHFRNNPSLQVLIMSDNPDLETLPVFKTFGLEHNTYSVYRFDCANCGLYHLEDNTFAEMPAITRLNLARNRLTGLPTGLLDNLSSLRELDLSDNIIDTLTPDMFRGATTLTKISLAGNPLITLQVAPFQMASNLARLDVSRCNLERVWSEARVPLKSLRYLSVRGNLLRRITVEELRATPKLSGLDLSHNPLDCDEDFNEAIQWLTDHGVEPTETQRYVQNYAAGDEYPVADGISQWTDLAKDVCANADDGPATRPAPHLPIDKFNILDTANMDSDILPKDFDDNDAFDTLHFNHGMNNNEDVENAWENQDQEYEDYVAKNMEGYHPWYSGTVWPVVMIVVTTLVLFLAAANIAVCLARRRGRGPVIRPPMILRQGLIDNKNCGLVYKPLHEEIPTPHMPKRGSFYSSSTFHYDKIVPESV